MIKGEVKERPEMKIGTDDKENKYVLQLSKSQTVGDKEVVEFAASLPMEYKLCGMNRKRILKAAGANRVCGLDDIMNAPINGSGCNENYGLLGSNKKTEDKIKLFPRECKELVLDSQKKIKEA